MRAFAVAVAIATAEGATASDAPVDCPDLAGHYRVDGFGPVLRDALEVLGLRLAGFDGSEVKIEGNADTALRFFIRSERSHPMSTKPVRTLARGIDYDCAGASIVLKATVEAERQGENAWLEGRSTIRLARSGQGLGVSAGFRGREHATLYSYDSARLSIPKPGTLQRLGGSIRWPHIDEPRPVEDVPIPESARVQAMRNKLTATLLGGVRLGGLSDSGDRVLASLRSQDAGEVCAFEDRLHAAGIAYTVKREPVWSNNGYGMQFQFDETGSGSDPRWRPSAFRVQKDIERMQHPMVSVGKIERDGDAYVARLDVLGGESTETVLKRLRLGATLVRTVAVIDDRPSEHTNLRHVRVRVGLD